MKPANKNIADCLERRIDFTSLKRELRYPELYVKEHWQNRPVIWFVAKREGYSGMMQNNNIAEDTLVALSNELLVSEQDSMSQELKLNVYPNPFKDYYIIESPVDDEILIQEPTGRIVMQQKILKGINRLRTDRFTNGIYFVRFVGQSRTFKLVKR